MLKSLMQRFEGVMDPFAPYEVKTPPADTFQFYMRFLRQTWKAFTALLVIGALATLAEVMVFRYLSDVVDMLTTTRPQDLWAKHGHAFIGMLVVLGLIWPALSLLNSLILRQGVSTNFATLIRWQSHQHVIRQSISFFTNDYAGRVASKVVDTAGALRNTLITLCDSLLYVSIYFTGAVVMFAQADGRLLIPLAVWALVYALFCWRIIPKLAKASEDGSEARSSLIGRIVDSYTNIQTAKLFATARREDDYVKAGLKRNGDAWTMQQRIITRLDLGVAIMNSALLISMGVLSIWLWSFGAISVGAIALVAALTNRLLGMSHWVMFQVTGLFENIGSVQNGVATISVPHSVLDTETASELGITGGAIRFDDVRFGYGKREEGRNALDGVTLNIKPGEKIGLVGPSGAGKSTFVNVFLRLYDIEGGHILIDGQDIAQVSQESLRAHIGVVTQDTSMLHRSIRDNVAYGKPDASDEEIWQALKLANAADFVTSLEDRQGRKSLDARAGERGVKLSGGQRQRIAIARVLLKNAPILLLDEATSALDSEVESAIQDSLNILMQGKTVIAIAHRLSTIARMDRLVVMDHGRIVEMGSHAELIASGGLYARLWAHQTGGFIAEDA